MQDTQNPDVNTPITDNDSDVERENENNSGNVEIPVPPDSQRNAPIEEPPESDKPSMEENTNEPKRIV
ncbi:MAG TPA: hypothetical protein VF556_14860 [Pyrinomonadaceae bacterium]|jgi:hypothetical protein